MGEKTAEEILAKNNRSIEYRERSIKKYHADRQQMYRKATHVCKHCCYIHGQIAGQAFTGYICSHCQKEAWHPNTHIPSVCPECAEALDICCHCGSKMD